MGQPAGFAKSSPTCGVGSGGLEDDSCPRRACGWALAFKLGVTSSSDWHRGDGVAARHQQIGVLLYQIIFISLYYTHYDTIIFHYDTIISLIYLQMSRLLFFIISLAPKGLLFHL